MPSCPSGQHNGGDGQCVSVGTCSEGFYDDGTGACGPLDVQSGQADVYLLAPVQRPLDMVFMIDNSPNTMGPKVAKMNAQFPKLIKALEDPTDGTLPDLRIAIIDGDLGSGGAYTTGTCGPKLLPDGTTSIFGDLGRFQMLKSPQNCTFQDGALFLEYQNGRPLNYTGDINTVFACLASNLGSFERWGCPLQHQLQAFEFALAAQGIGNEAQQKAFLRSDAVLALVFITDEDDCSAATNDGLFGDKPELAGEDHVLRCATRAHQCGGKNLTEAPPGYPTVASFSHPFKDCRARMGDECSIDTDTSQPTACNPLRSIKTLADEIKALKQDPDNQILVAGIFGWPLDEADLAKAEYKIAPIPNPDFTDPAHPTAYASWPVCHDPDHPPKHLDPATGMDPDAFARGAAGGLREAAYVDEFGQHGLKFSICQRDFADSMSTIGNTLASMLYKSCVGPKLVDIDANQPGVQPDCTVLWRYPEPDPSDASQVIWRESATPLPECPEGATAGSVSAECWRPVSDAAGCPKSGLRLDVLRSEVRSQPSLAPGTKIHARCRVCPNQAAGAGCE